MTTTWKHSIAMIFCLVVVFAWLSPAAGQGSCSIFRSWSAGDQ